MAPTAKRGRKPGSKNKKTPIKATGAPVSATDGEMGAPKDVAVPQLKIKIETPVQISAEVSNNMCQFFSCKSGRIRQLILPASCKRCCRHLRRGTLEVKIHLPSRLNCRAKTALELSSSLRGLKNEKL